MRDLRAGGTERWWSLGFHGGEGGSEERRTPEGDAERQRREQQPAFALFVFWIDAAFADLVVLAESPSFLLRRCFILLFKGKFL